MLVEMLVVVIEAGIPGLQLVLFSIGVKKTAPYYIKREKNVYIYIYTYS